MTNKTLISIILPVYNGERFLEEAIESCLKQTYKNFELIIVNDCSTDGSLIIAEKFQAKDDRVCVISNTENRNLPTSLNLGHNLAIGDYVTWTSDDNILKPFFLQKLLSKIQKTDCDIVYSNYDILNEDGTLKRTHCSGPVSHLLFGNSIGASFLYKREVFRNLKGYDENLHTLEDYDFWLRASIQFSFYYLNENLYQYRLHGQSLTRSLQTKSYKYSSFMEKKKEMYLKIGRRLKWQPETFVMLTSIANPEGFYFDYFKTNHGIIINDIQKYNGMLQKKNGSALGIEKLNAILRNNLKLDSSNKNLKNLFWVLIHHPGIFFSKNYSRSETLKLLKSCIM